MYRGLFFLLLLPFLLSSCSNEISDPGDDSASITVRVLAEDNSPIVYAQVILRNTTFHSVTDSLGRAEFINVPAGEYEIAAYIKSVGSGRTAIKAEKGPNQATVSFIYNTLFEPLIQAVDYYQCATNDTVRIDCFVTDMYTESESIKVAFTLNNEILQSGYPDPNGFIKFVSPDFPPIVDTLFVTAVNQDNVSAEKGIIIAKTNPFRVKLELESAEDGIVKLKWDESNDENFDGYYIQRNAGFDFWDYKVIKDRHITSFIDSSTTFSSQIAYRIQTKNTGTFYTSYSNEIDIEHPNGNTMYLDFRNLLIHPSKPYLYLFENYNEISSSKIFMYNFMTGEYITEISTVSDHGLASIAETNRGVEIVVPSTEGEALIYDENLSLKKTFNISNDAWCSLITENGYIYISHNDLTKSYNGDTGLIVDSTNVRPYHFQELKGKNALFGYDGPSLIYFNIDNQGQILSHTGSPAHNYLYEYVWSVSPSELYAILGSSGEIYHTDQSLSYICTIPGGGKRDAVFNDTDDTIYVAASGQKAVMVYAYPSFILLKEIRTKGYPFKLFLRDGQLVTVSQIPDWIYIYGIEKFRLN